MNTVQFQTLEYAFIIEIMQPLNFYKICHESQKLIQCKIANLRKYLLFQKLDKKLHNLDIRRFLIIFIHRYNKWKDRIENAHFYIFAKETYLITSSIYSSANFRYRRMEITFTKETRTGKKNQAI